MNEKIKNLISQYQKIPSLFNHIPTLAVQEQKELYEAIYKLSTQQLGEFLDGISKTPLPKMIAINFYEYLDSENLKKDKIVLDKVCHYLSFFSEYQTKVLLNSLFMEEDFYSTNIKELEKLIKQKNWPEYEVKIDTMFDCIYRTLAYLFKNNPHSYLENIGYLDRDKRYSISYETLLPHCIAIGLETIDLDKLAITKSGKKYSYNTDTFQKLTDFKIILEKEFLKNKVSSQVKHNKLKTL